MDVGHMAKVGGFILVDPEDEDKDSGEQDRKVLTFDALKQLLQDPKFKCPTISEADIQDCSIRVDRNPTNELVHNAEHCSWTAAISTHGIWNSLRWR